jgi:hypothetical protein
VIAAPRYWSAAREWIGRSIDAGFLSPNDLLRPSKEAGPSLRPLIRAARHDSRGLDQDALRSVRIAANMLDEVLARLA